MKTQIKIFLLLVIFITFSCKTNKAILISNNCFYEKEGLVYINFYNLSDTPKLIPNISGIIDESFHLLKDNYNLANDTLIIQLADKRNVHVSDSEPANVIKINDSILMNKKKRVQQVFKSNLRFNVISFNRDSKKTILNRCD